MKKYMFLTVDSYTVIFFEIIFFLCSLYIYNYNYIYIKSEGIYLKSILKNCITVNCQT